MDTRPAIFTAGADEEVINKFIAGIKGFVDKCDEHWADGRERVAGPGANVTAGDLVLLTGYTSLITNSNLRNPRVSTELSEYVQTKENYMRVLNKIKGDLQSTVDGLGASWI